MQVTGISNAAEHELGRRDLVPFLLENRIKEAGILYLGCFKIKHSYEVVADGDVDHPKQ